MSNLYPRGSEWRKWDLHIHSPGTKINNQYKLTSGDVLEEFCKKIEQSDVHAFGIADYFSIDGYLSFIEKFRTIYPDSKKIFFPNIELRTSYVVNGAKEEVNLHVIFNSFISDVEDKAKKFLQYLDTNKTVDGGRHVKASELSVEVDFQEATTNKEFIKEAFRQTFGDKADLMDFILIFTAANNDGIRAESGVKRKMLITDELDKFSDGFFGNSNNAEYFLNKNRLEGSEETIEKPVVSGCDAHSLSDVDTWLGKLVLVNGEIVKQPTWIKADLTFEGLKQIIYEPRERVFIGEEPGINIRIRSNKTKYLRALHIDQIEGYDNKHGIWFKSEKIDLNPELVAIIGNKGSGKSAVTDTVGLIGNSHNQKYDGANGKPEELFSFLNKEKFLKGRFASNFYGELHWHAGESDSKQLDSQVDKVLPEKVEYLPQKYLEKICANIEDDEFRGKLNEVIFGYVEEKDRYEKINLEELITYLTSQTEEDIRKLKEALHKVNEKIILTEKKLSIDYKKSIEEKKKIKEEEIETNNKLKPAEVQKPVESQPTTPGPESEIISIESDLKNLKTLIASLKLEQTTTSKKVQDFNLIKQAIVRQVKSLSELKDQYQKQLEENGIKFEDIVTVSANYQKIDQLIEVNQHRLTEISELIKTEDEIKSLQLDEVEEKKLLDKSLTFKQSQLEKKKKEIVDKLDQPNQAYQSYLKDYQKWEIKQKELIGEVTAPLADTLNWLSQELTAIASSYPVELSAAKNERRSLAKKLFKEKTVLSSFYNSVKQSIDGEIKKYGEELGDYDVSIEASLRLGKGFYDEFFQFLNQGVKGSFHGTDDGRVLLKKIAEEVGDWQAEDAVMAFTDSIILHIDNDKRGSLPATESKARDVFKQMKQGKDPVEFYDYIFGLDYLETKYDLKVDEKDLSELSPGERGGLLLIFYLMLDRRDIPLIIDQPEDNLDNKSVYEILVTFLKKAKKRRQIIMVTHNPNLAVVADAEQIIHVSIDKKKDNDFDFYSGAIEDPRINKAVVDILEGTLPAFDNRKIKYRKQLSKV